MESAKDVARYFVEVRKQDWIILSIIFVGSAFLGLILTELCSALTQGWSLLFAWVMDVFGIVYIIENPQQFWSELEDILHTPNDLTLGQLDSALRRFVSFCACYHEQYLQDPMQLQHSCDLLLGSELFTFHSERMCDLLLQDAQTSTDPHCQLILYNILLAYGRRNSAFLRSQKKWQPLVPLLMDHIQLDLDPDIDEIYPGGASVGVPTSTTRGIAVPIEARLRLLSVGILYEVCRVQKLSMQELRVFNDAFIEHLFELVEMTRNQADETFNYTVIKLIVALNEQFMVASIQPLPHSPRVDLQISEEQQPTEKSESQNRVLRILMSRLGNSMTFGENMIFMLNRADRTPEDLVMQLLVLKILYLLFTTKGTCEFFYFNDLKVLVDVFLREITDLDEENESLRHTYLRVLHPLLTRTQLRTMPYKRPQIVQMLESLIEHEHIRDINPTTKRLVQRCLNGDWCMQFRKPSHIATANDFERRVGSPGLESVVSAASLPAASSSHALLSATLPQETAGGKIRTLKTSRSAEHLKAPAKPPRKGRAAPSGHPHRTGSKDSTTSLPRVAAAEAVPPKTRRPERAGSVDAEVPAASQGERRKQILDDTAEFMQDPPEIRIVSPGSESTSASSAVLPEASLSAPPSVSASPTPRQRRAAPAPPPRRRKPPAVPTLTNANSITLTTIASSSQTSLPPSPRKNILYQAVA